MRAWQHWALRSHRSGVALRLSMRDRVGGAAAAGRVRRFASVSNYPSNAESAMTTTSDDDDRDDSHLVCGKCNAPISKTRDLVFFKWRNGIHVSCMTQAPLQRLRTQDHWSTADSEWKKHKLHCLQCSHTVGSIVTVFNSDKILFSAREMAIQMPEHLSPMISLSGYPSSILGFSMWSELLLMLESQPNLKSQLQIRRVDNIRDFSVEKKEINTLLMLASDLKALLDVVEKHSTEMNHVNVLTALHRASLLVAAKKKAAPQASTPRFAVRSEAPEDDLMDLPVHAFVDPKKEKTAADHLNKRLWKLVDSVEGLMNFGISAMQNPFQLTALATDLWRLNIGRPSILRPMCMRMVKFINDKDQRITTLGVLLVASAAAHLSSKDIRHEDWMRDALTAAADVTLKNSLAFEDKAMLHDQTLPLARSFVLTGHFHEAFFQRFFEAVNMGLLEGPRAPAPQQQQHQHQHSSRGNIKGWQARLYQLHVDNRLAKRSTDVLLAEGQRLTTYRASFIAYEKQQKNALFRTRHVVASALESMGLKPHVLYAVGNDGYVVDMALTTQKIAIEINTEDAYVMRDPRLGEDLRGGGEYDDDDTVMAFVDDDDGAMATAFRYDPPLRVTLPFADLKARHLEHLGWIVVQLNADEFMELDDQDKRVEHLSMLIEIATYSRAEALSAEQGDDGRKGKAKKRKQ